MKKVVRNTWDAVVNNLLNIPNAKAIGRAVERSVPRATQKNMDFSQSALWSGGDFIPSPTYKGNVLQKKREVFTKYCRDQRGNFPWLTLKSGRKQQLS